MPNNEGSFQPMRTWAPEGSVLNPRYPAATGGRGMIGHMLPPAIMGAVIGSFTRPGMGRRFFELARSV